MSRQQWGHGYRKGLEDATKASLKKGWGIVLDKNGKNVWCFEVLDELPDKTLLIMKWNSLSMATHYNMGETTGSLYYAVFKAGEGEVIISDVEEYKPNPQKEETKLFFTFAAMMGEWVRQQERMHGKNWQQFCAFDRGVDP